MKRLTLATWGVVMAAVMATGSVAAADCSVELTGNDAMQFSTKEISIAASCEQFTINFTHTGKLPKNVMGHNVVVAKTDDVSDLAKLSIAAGLAKNYTAEDPRIVAASDLVGGGEQTSVVIDVKVLDAAANYTYFCSFPGHSAIMRGVIKRAQ